MGATKKRRQTKHRGNAAGMVEARGRSSASRTAGSGSAAPRGPKPPQPPSWNKAMFKALLPVAILIPILLIFQKGSTFASAAPLLLMAYAMYVPLSYWSDRFVYNRHLKQQGKR